MNHNVTSNSSSGCLDSLLSFQLLPALRRNKSRRETHSHTCLLTMCRVMYDVQSGTTETLCGTASTSHEGWSQGNASPAHLLALSVSLPPLWPNRRQQGQEACSMRRSFGCLGTKIVCQNGGRLEKVSCRLVMAFFMSTESECRQNHVSLVMAMVVSCSIECLKHLPAPFMFSPLHRIGCCACPQRGRTLAGHKA